MIARRSGADERPVGLGRKNAKI